MTLMIATNMTSDRYWSLRDYSQNRDVTDARFGAIAVSAGNSFYNDFEYRESSFYPGLDYGEPDNDVFAIKIKRGRNILFVS